MLKCVYVDGVPQLRMLFKKLPDRVSAKVLRKSLMAAGGVYKRAAAAKVQTENLMLTGELKKSMLVRMARKKYRDIRMVAIGPRYKTITKRRTKKGELRGVRTGKLGSKADMNVRIMKAKGVKLIRINPGKYAHLVEFGHKIVTRRKTKYDKTIRKEAWEKAKQGARVVPPHPFMRPTFAAKTGAAKRAYNKMFMNSLSHEVRKLKKR